MDDYGSMLPQQNQFKKRSKTDIRVRPPPQDDYMGNLEYQQKPVKRVIREPKMATVTPDSLQQRSHKYNKTGLSNYSGEIEISNVSDIISENDPRNTKTPQKPDFEEYETLVISKT